MQSNRRDYAPAKEKSRIRCFRILPRHGSNGGAFAVRGSDFRSCRG